MKPDPCEIPCLVCGSALGNFQPDGGNHPLGGLEFKTPGHYGSAVFDHQTGLLAINVCGPCLRDASATGRVLNYLTPPSGVRRGTYKRWPASADTHPKDGDVQQAPLVSGAVPERQTPNPSRQDTSPSSKPSEEQP